MDRLGDTFRWKSENVSTAEVSEVLGNFPGVIEANVYGVEVPGHDGRAGCAALYIDPTHLPAFDFHALHRHAHDKLPRYAVPVWIRVLKSLTTTHNNKQPKVLLRNDGIDIRKIRERMESEAKEKGIQPVHDSLYFAPQGLGHSKEIGAEGYVEYKEEHWEQIRVSAPGSTTKL
jgi:hypothetical protein